VIAKARRKLAFKDTPQLVKEWATKLKPEHWRKCVEDVVHDRVDAAADEIQALVEKVIEEETE
jgi:hypothetical protein